jgi:hypothetical protein
VRIKEVLFGKPQEEPAEQVGPANSIDDAICSRTFRQLSDSFGGVFGIEINY